MEEKFPVFPDVVELWMPARLNHRVNVGRMMGLQTPEVASWLLIVNRSSGFPLMSDLR